MTIHTTQKPNLLRVTTQVGRQSMRPTAHVLALLALLFCDSAEATSIMPCREPSPAESLSVSDVVVVATIEAKTLDKVEGSWRQTLLWRVNESWKGRHYKNSTFTTRVRLTDPEDVEVGQAFLLKLEGTEPYEWASCSRNRGYLPDSLEDVHEVYKEFYRLREIGHSSHSSRTRIRAAY